MCCVNRAAHGPRAYGHTGCCCSDTAGQYRSKKKQIEALEEELARMREQVTDLEDYIAEVKAD